MTDLETPPEPKPPTPPTPAGSPPGLQLRRAQPADAPAFARMMSDPAVYAQVLQTPFASTERWRSLLEEQSKAGQPDLHLVAECDGQLVGSAGLHPGGGSLRRRHAMGLGITVAREWQGRGVGRTLMAALCDYADHWAGLLRVELTVYADNLRAQALYRRFGFVEEGRHRAYALRDGEFVDALAMARLHPNPPKV